MCNVNKIEKVNAKKQKEQLLSLSRLKTASENEQRVALIGEEKQNEC